VTKKEYKRAREKEKRDRERAKLLRRFERLRARIEKHVIIDPESGCWLWTGRLNKGHGVIVVRLPGDYRTPRPLYVHRVAWEAYHERKMPVGRVGAHSYKCVAARCCNPSHIRATTQSANNRDQKRARKWRERTLHGGVLHPPTHSIKGGR
jgi:hypothetical protein